MPTNRAERRRVLRTFRGSAAPLNMACPASAWPEPEQIEIDFANSSRNIGPGQKRKVNEEIFHEAVKLYDNVSIADIAKQFNVSKATLASWFHRRDVPVRSRKEASALAIQRGKFANRGGINNATWKGGQFTDDWGYIRVLMPEHLRADQRGYVMKSILVMEAHLGRSLTKEEIVHHIDEVKANNDVSNLELFPNRNEHVRHHNQSNALEEGWARVAQGVIYG